MIHPVKLFPYTTIIKTKYIMKSSFHEKITNVLQLDMHYVTFTLAFQKLLNSMFTNFSIFFHFIYAPSEYHINVLLPQDIVFYINHTVVMYFEIPKFVLTKNIQQLYIIVQEKQLQAQQYKSQKKRQKQNFNDLLTKCNPGPTLQSLISMHSWLHMSEAGRSG